LNLLTVTHVINFSRAMTQLRSSFFRDCFIVADSRLASFGQDQRFAITALHSGSNAVAL